MKDRKQYLLVLANKTISTFAPIELRLQFPYPIDESEVLSQKDTDNVRFEPIGQAMTTVGDGSLTVLRNPLSSSYQLRIDKMEPRGQAEILLILNSWRDPRGKAIPPDEAVRYMVPEWGPEITYLDGYFKYRVGDEMVRRAFYAPLDLSEDRIVTLGKQQARPKGLKVRVDVQ
jgi:hypothetical protein